MTEKLQRGAVEELPAIRINALEWFRRPDFQAFLNGPNVATWHPRGREPGEYSDVFVTYDHGDGSDQDAIPEDIWIAIMLECEGRGVSYGLVWISPVEVLP